MASAAVARRFYYLRGSLVRSHPFLLIQTLTNSEAPRNFGMYEVSLSVGVLFRKAVDLSRHDRLLQAFFHNMGARYLTTSVLQI